MGTVFRGSFEVIVISGDLFDCLKGLYHDTILGITERKSTCICHHDR